LLVGLIAWIFDDTPVFAQVGPAMLGMFPFIVMFLVTSITTLRERRSGTLERLLTLPLGKGDFIGGYAPAFRPLASRPAAGGRRVGRVGVRPRDRGLARDARARRSRQRAARHDARAVRERLRDDRVPGGAVHARDRRPAGAARRHLPGAGSDAGDTAGDLRLA